MISEIYCIGSRSQLSESSDRLELQLHRTRILFSKPGYWFRIVLRYLNYRHMRGGMQGVAVG